MAIADANAVVNLITKTTAFAQQIALGWYKASQAMESFPSRLIVLNQQSNSWTTLLKKYGVKSDPFIKPALEAAIQLLALEEDKLKQLQQNCCLRLCKKLLLPESLIAALDNVIAAFQNLPELLTAHQTREQQVAKATLCRVAPLGFSQDSKYVPLEGTIMKVRSALESKATGPVVMISGGPGQGKTSMAKYLACLYRDGTDPLPPAQGAQAEIQSTQTGPPNRFVDGVFFLHCGDKADSKSLLLQLWQDLGYQDLPSSTGQGQVSSTEEMPLALQSEDAMHKQLSARLADQEILIILDDLWNSTIINRVLVQQQGIKYLITTQISRIWTDAMCAEIPIPELTFQEAKQILANHVKGFPTEVSSDLQVQINTIIDKSAANPLVLANVATNIHLGRASELEEWKTTRRYLSDLQDGDAKRPVSLYGRSYSKKTMGASIEMALGSFSSEEQTLVFLACLCDLSQPVPEVVFKILFKKVHLSLAKFFRCSEQLETNNFIQIESKTNPSSDVPQRSWSLHTMRQNFIKMLRQEEIASMFSKLLENSSSDKMVAILLVLYGQQSWRDQAASKMGILAHESGGKNSKASYSMLSSIRPFVWLLNGDGEEGWQKQSHHLAKQILNNYLDSCEVDNDVMSQLLGIPETIPAACQALLQFAIFIEKPLFKNNNGNQILLTFVNLLNCKYQKDSQNQLKGILSFFYELCFYYKDDAIKIASYPGMVNALAQFLVKDVDPMIQEHASWTLGELSREVVQNAIKIGSYPSIVERLVELLHERVSPTTQGSAAWALGHLSKDVVDNAIKIGSYPSAMERLVGLLQEGVSPKTQQWAAWALGQLSKDVVDNAIKIGSYPSAMERLVGLLQERVSPTTQERAASALGHLSKNVVDNAIKIGSYPSAVERLVELLQEGVSPTAQGSAAWALGQLSRNVVDNAIKIGSYPSAVERLVELLQEGVSPTAQGHVAWALGQLSKNVVVNAIKIGSYPSAVERLVGLLQEGVSPTTQERATWALGQLSNNVVNNAIKIGSYPSAVERLVELLQEGVSPKTQQGAAWALGQLSRDVVDNAIKIGSYPSAVERLVGLLQEGVSPTAQEDAAWALGQLSKNVVDNAIKIGSCSDAMGGFVGLLVKEGSSTLQMHGAIALWHTCCGVVENQVLLKRTLVETEIAMEKFKVLLMSEEQRETTIQYWCAKVYEMANIESGRIVTRYQSCHAYEGKGDAKVFLQDYKAALEAYENGQACEFHAEMIRKICFVKAKLGDFEGALKDANKFLDCCEDRPFGLQERAVLRIMMGNFHGALADLNEGLEPKPDDYEMLKHRGLVKFLLKDEAGARADAEWALRIKHPKVDSYQYGTGPCLGTISVDYLGYKLK